MDAFPPPPVNTIDWSNVGFKVREVNGHIESTYSKSTGKWSPLRFVEYIPQGLEEPGPLFEKLLKHLKDIQLGNTEDQFNWRFLVSEADKNIEGAANGGRDDDTTMVNQMN